MNHGLVLQRSQSPGKSLGPGRHPRPTAQGHITVVRTAEPSRNSVVAERRCNGVLQFGCKKALPPFGRSRGLLQQRAGMLSGIR